MIFHLKHRTSGEKNAIIVARLNYAPPNLQMILMLTNFQIKLTSIVLILASWALSSSSIAQVVDQRRANRRTFVEGLLRGLLESELEAQNRRPVQGPNARLPKANVRPTPGLPTPAQVPLVKRNPAPGQPVARQPKRALDIGQPRRQPVIVSDPNIVDIRRIVQQWSEESDQLIDDLRRLEFNNPSVRPLLADALQLRVNLDLVARRAQNSINSNYFIDDIRTIDQQWRMLNYRLKSVPAAIQQSRQCIASCGKFNQQLGTIFGLQPQFDNQRVLQLTSELATDLNHLARDLRYEILEEPACTNMINQCRTIYSIIQQSPPPIRRSDYNTVLKLYKSGLGQWRTLNRQISAYPSQRLRHQVQDIEAIGRQIQEQLYIPYEIDRNYLAQLSTNVGTSSNNVFRQISLENLLALDNPTAVLDAARSFQQQCDRFSNSIRSQVPANQLMVDFGQFESTWNGMRDQCSVIKNPALGLELDEIHYSMQTLHEAFGTQPLLDHGSMVRLTIELEDLTHQLENLSGKAPSNIQRAAKRLHKRCYDFNKRVLTERLYDPKPGRLKQLFEFWVDFKNDLSGYQGPNARALNEYRRRIEPLMVKLQVIYQQ